ncbi:MAG: DNA-processing protein DprA [Lentisphaeria bacterium]|nr:DNA-processing protein DprA [Candidatus Neomarinimicrobiota bacterium]MCF7841392.1 DNA-processing protein DprA [Lentisphaeria bacterium]
MQLTDSQIALLRLLAVPGVGPRKAIDLLQHVGNPVDIFSTPAKSLGKIPGIHAALTEAILMPPDDALLEGQVKLLEKFDVGMLSILDDEFPEPLKRIYDPPVVLFYRGNIELLKNPMLGIVGTRAPTSAGKRVTRELSQGLAEAGISVVSGFARGVDTTAHETALRYPASTIAVLGCGVDRVYPAENRRLFEEMVTNGLIISEFMVGTKPDAPNFPRRNRIISGLSQGIVVVEAGAKSGALITAYMALDQNREVFAVPGSIYNNQSMGTNRLIQQGAKLVTGIDDILQEIGGRFGLGVSQGQIAMPIGLDGEEARIFEALSSEPQHIDNLAEKLETTTFALLGLLLQLELKGLAQQLPGKQFVRKG